MWWGKDSKNREQPIFLRQNYSKRELLKQMLAWEYFIEKWSKGTEGRDWKNEANKEENPSVHYPVGLTGGNSYETFQNF